MITRSYCVRFGTEICHYLIPCNMYRVFSYVYWNLFLNFWYLARHIFNAYFVIINKLSKIRRNTSYHDKHKQYSLYRISNREIAFCFKRASMPSAFYFYVKNCDISGILIFFYRQWTLINKGSASTSIHNWKSGICVNVEDWHVLIN